VDLESLGATELGSEATGAVISHWSTQILALRYVGLTPQSDVGLTPHALGGLEQRVPDRVRGPAESTPTRAESVEKPLRRALNDLN
jgi:hypothetical protein